jgi:very-short-patch-repair endonuclease
MQQVRAGSLSTDARIAALAATQHGVVTRTQLAAAGIDGCALDRRVRRGLLRPVHRGVFAVGPTVGRRAREMAAVLACGAGAVAADRTAGALLRLTPVQRLAEPVSVIVGKRRVGRRPGILARQLVLAPGETTTVDGVPVTTPARTLLDLAALLTAEELERALAVAEREKRLTRVELEALITRHPRHRGTRALRSFLDLGHEPAFDRSMAERRMLDLIQRAQLPRPATNVRIHGLEVDLWWKPQRLVAEIDGFAFHSARSAFERDRDRDQILAAAGIVVVRITWWQLTREPLATMVRLARTLTRQECRLERVAGP